MINAGGITVGDRANGGVLEVKSLKGNLLHYRTLTTPLSLVGVIGDDRDYGIYSKLSEMPQAFGGWVLYKVNLDDPELLLKFDGIEFMDQRSYEVEYHRNVQDRCFDQTVLQYIKSDKSALTPEQAKRFKEDVISCIKKQTKKH